MSKKQWGNGFYTGERSGETKNAITATIERCEIDIDLVFWSCRHLLRDIMNRFETQSCEEISNDDSLFAMLQTVIMLFRYAAIIKGRSKSRINDIKICGV